MTELWTDPTADAIARARDDGGDWVRTLFYWAVFLLYTGLLAWSAYDLGARDAGQGLICEPPVKVTRPSGRVP